MREPRLWLGIGLLMAAASCAPSAYAADASHCYSIQDRDRQNYCLAAAKREASYCYSIQNRSFQNFCLAQIKSEKSYCYSIQERDIQNQCLAAF
ncbi:MAG: hypothetical protein EBU34_13300 [Alphaproteobacteria bacterium]|nr:hypothetical protein [Beijerinckiaceae bacterium]NBQ40717.1 hypothetical protein [Alphaproteobacteria bacterium]